MTDLDDEYDEVVVFDVAENAIVADAVAPFAGEIVLEGFAEGARIIGWCDAILKEAPDAFGYRPIQLGKLSLGALIELNRPHRRD